MASKIVEKFVQCPGCLTFESVEFQGKVMIPTIKFWQRDGKVYHDCRLTDKPCLVLPKFKGER